jgi:hypothetical protein
VVLLCRGLLVRAEVKIVRDSDFGVVLLLSKSFPKESLELSTAKLENAITTTIDRYEQSHGHGIGGDVALYSYVQRMAAAHPLSSQRQTKGSDIENVHS